MLLRRLILTYLKVIKQPTPQAVGKTLGLFYYTLMQRQLTSKLGFDAIIDRIDKSENMGIDMIFNNEAYKIEISQNHEHPKTKEKRQSSSNWFFDTKTFLPIGFLHGSSFKSYNILATNEEVSLTTFDINHKKEFEEELISGNEAKNDGMLKVGTKIPEFILKDIDGNSKSLSSLKSEITIIDFWGTWCGPCVVAMPDLQSLYDKYNGNGLNVIGISVKDTPQKVKNFIARKEFNYQFLVEGEEVAKLYNVDTYPSIYVIDKDGIIIHAEKGRRDDAKDEIEKIILKEIKS